MGKCEHDDGVHGYVSLHMKDCPYCRIAGLEALGRELYYMACLCPSDLLPGDYDFCTPLEQAEALLREVE